MEANNFHDIVTSDESCFTLELRQSAKWSTSHEDLPQRVRQQIGTREFILTVIWGVDRFRVVNLMISRRAFDSECFEDNLIVSVVEKVLPNGRNPDARRVHLQLDNCGVHFPSVAEQFTAQNHISPVAQLPSTSSTYRPDRNDRTNPLFSTTDFASVPSTSSYSPIGRRRQLFDAQAFGPHTKIPRNSSLFRRPITRNSFR
jgi:hypothetical protein